MRCHLATAVTIDTPRPPQNPVRSIVNFVSKPLADGLLLTDHLVAGAVASAAAVAALHPMDTLKTVIQKAASTTTTTTATTMTTTASAAAPQSLNAVSALFVTLRSGGVPALYRGLAPNLIGQVPAGAVKFAAYESLTQLARTFAPRFGNSSASDYVCAALAFTVCSVVLVPGELLKQRLQAGVYPSMTSAVSNMIRREGLRTMYTGYKATLARDIPYTMLEFGLYAQLKRGVRAMLTAAATAAGKEDKSLSLTSSQELALGGVAGGCTGFLTTPLDVAKTKLMTQGGVGKMREYSGIVDVLVKVGRQEGLQGLFKGSTARVVWLIPFTAVYFGVHEATKRSLRARKQQQNVVSPLMSTTKKEENKIHEE